MMLHNIIKYSVTSLHIYSESVILMLTMCFAVERYKQNFQIYNFYVYFYMESLQILITNLTDLKYKMFSKSRLLLFTSSNTSLHDDTSFLSFILNFFILLLILSLISVNLSHKCFHLTHQISRFINPSWHRFVKLLTSL